MQGQDLLHLQIQALHVLHQVHAQLVRPCRCRAVRRAGGVSIGLNQNFFARQVDHHEAPRMQVALDVVNLHHALAVGKDTFAAHAANYGPLARALERVRVDAVRVRQHLFKIRTRQLAGDQGCALGGCGAQATRMVEVVVRIDDQGDRLAAGQLFDFGQHGCGAPVGQRALDHHQVVFHLDGHAVVGATGHKPYTFGHLVGAYPLGGGAYQRRGLDAGRHIGFDVVHGQIQHRKPPQVLADASGKLYASKVLVVGKAYDGGGVTQHGIGLHRVNPLYQPRRVDQCGGAEATGYRERNRSQGAAVFHALGYGGLVRQCRLDDAMRCGPQIVGPAVYRPGRRYRRGPGHVPGIAAAHQAGGALFACAHERYRTAAGRLGAAARGVFAKCQVVIVGHAGKAGIGNPGPGHAGLERLAKAGAAAAAAKRNAAQRGATHGYIGTLQHGVGALGRHTGARHQAEKHECQRDAARVIILLNKLHGRLRVDSVALGMDKRKVC